MSLTPADFEPDCSSCVALCCVAFAFDRSEEFGHDKPADHACRHLDEAFGCAIHERLERSGYVGCVRFDCHGAGQRVTQELFSGRDWKSAPELFAPMMAAFRTMRRLHALLQMLDAAGSLGLDAAAEDLRQSLIGMLDPETGWTAKTIAQFDIDTADGQISGFLKSLAMRIADR